MADSPRRQVPFATVAMAEILLGQDMLDEAADIVQRLKTEYGDDPRVAELERRLRDRSYRGEILQTSLPETGSDRIFLDGSPGGGMRITFELTPEGLGIAKRRVRYSGHTIVRLFTAAPGPRGVRTFVRDMEIEKNCAHMDLFGLPARAVHVAAVGFLGRNGAFVPLAGSSPWRDKA